MNPSLIFRVGPHARDVFDVTSWYSLVGIFGCLLWIVAYGYVVYVGFKEKAHGIPGPAICLNLGWEILASFVWDNPVPAWKWLDRAWFVIDLIIIGQLLYYGRDKQKSPLVRRLFYFFVFAGVIASTFGQLIFAQLVFDKVGMLTAFTDNLIMSVLFLFLLRARRPGLEGLSTGAAWTKMIGTVCTAVMGYVMFPKILHDHVNRDMAPYVVGMYAVIFALDATYTYLLLKARRDNIPSSIEGV